jgi:glycosyltransferase involved in cell wall biosynthesis
VRVVIDAIAVRYGGFAVALEALLEGWTQLDVDDELHLMMARGADLAVPDSVTVHAFDVGRGAALAQLRLQTLVLPRICRALTADVLFAMLPATSVRSVGCPKVIMVYDLRHELRPEQFSGPRRLLRRLSYGAGYYQAAGIICISERTRRDLVRSRPALERKKRIRSVQWGADHVDRWPRPDPEPPVGRMASAQAQQPYALAFGHFANKGVDLVLDAWKLLMARGEAFPLQLVGLPTAAREAVAARIDVAGLSRWVTPLPWLETDDFRRRFTAAGMVVFPSEFEGFGLPAVEAMQLGIPLVISSDEALLEVTGGHASVMRDWSAAALADAVAEAKHVSFERLACASTFVATATWRRAAAQTRAELATAIRMSQFF